jgi:cytochrome P450 family 110
MSLPNGPTSPALWQMLQWLATPVAFMRACRDRYGDCFTVTFGKRCPPTVFCSHPSDLQLLLSGDDAGLFESPGHLDDELEPLLGTQSLMALSGERHRRMRQLLMPPFHGERMRSYGQLIGDITAEVMAQQGVGKPFQARKAMQRLSLRVILRAVFGVKEGARYERLEGLLGRMLDALSDPLAASPLFMPALRKDFGPWSPWGRFLRLRRQVDPLLYQEIAERRTHPDASRPDILTLLLAARDQAGEALTDGELRDELMTLLAAGHETTATALTWALFWIHKLPAVRQRLLEELQALNGPLDPAALARLPYLNAVCSETLRIYPVGMVTFTRVTKSAVELAGCRLEPGTRVVGCIYLAHQREEVYPNADQFRPERFLERRYSPFEYLPFGGGVRRCIGMAFAQFEMKVALSGILSGFDLALADGRSVRPVRRGVTAGPSPFRMVVKACRSTPPRPIRQASSLNG